MADRDGGHLAPHAHHGAGRRALGMRRRGAARRHLPPAGGAVERGGGVVSGARVAVIRFPGVNCEAESARALERVGLEAEIFLWTRPAGELRSFDAYLLPGGWSYQDRVRAG